MTDCKEQVYSNEYFDFIFLMERLILFPGQIPVFSGLMKIMILCTIRERDCRLLALQITVMKRFQSALGCWTGLHWKQAEFYRCRYSRSCL